MSTTNDAQRIAFVGDYFPRQCGIATFTHDLYTAVTSQYPKIDCFVAPVNDRNVGYPYPGEVRFEFQEHDLSSYERAADFLNFNNTGVVSLQHEFGIYGGADGSYILTLLRRLRVPAVTTLHTILREPTSNQMQIMHELTSLSARLVVMTERGRDFLTSIYHVSGNKIDIIPHGIPDMPFVDPNFYKDQFDVDGKYLLLTFGLLSPNKGIENVLQSLPQVIAEFHNIVYIILGATHPALIEEHVESYRMSLERLTHDLGIKRHVTFCNRFVDAEQLNAFIGAADIYITPYLNEEQITSGTLAYALGCGKAIISTPYLHAKELLADGRGVLVPFKNPDAIAKAIIRLFKDASECHVMRKKAYLLGREMVWAKVAHSYMKSFQKARQIRLEKKIKPLAIITMVEQRSRQLPAFRLGHLIRSTDSTGLLQHAKFSIPLFSQGYCTDDNARGLLLTVLLEELNFDQKQISPLAQTYAAFLQYAFNLQKKRFRNFMSFDRRWLDEVGSDDSQGRAFWALGACVGRSKNRDLQMWAAQLFDLALPTVTALKHPRAWTLTLLGIHEYFRRLDGDRLVNKLRDELTQKLIDIYDKNATEDWPWFEKKLTYNNAKLPHALILSGRWSGNHKAFQIGLQTLKWLADVQTAEAGHFRPIGTNGFYSYGTKRAHFDQQPIEAHAMVSASLEAFYATKDSFWFDEANKAFEWFLGRNDLGLALYDSKTGGCHDALHADRLNLNQGAESTLAFLMSLAEIQLEENLLMTLNHSSHATAQTKTPFKVKQTAIKQ